MKKLSLPILMIAALLILSSCNYPSSSATATVAPMDAINTAAAQTVVAMSTALAATTAAPAPGSSTQASQETPVPADNELPVVTLPPLQSVTPASGDTASVCDRMKFVKDMTVPDHSVFAPNTSFTKTWRLQNAGTCSWTSGYRLVFDTGDALSGPASVNLPETVAPGQEVDVSVNLKTPAATGEYKGYWKLENASGRRFGWGDGDKAVWVIVDVKTTPVPFAVTSLTLSVDHDNVVANQCPYTFNFDIGIRASGAGTVTYHLEASDGTKTNPKEVDFSEAGTKDVSRSIKIDSDFQGWVKVYIDDPNHQYLGQVNLKLDCP